MEVHGLDAAREVLDCDSRRRLRELPSACYRHDCGLPAKTGHELYRHLIALDVVGLSAPADGEVEDVRTGREDHNVADEGRLAVWGVTVDILPALVCIVVLVPLVKGVAELLDADYLPLRLRRGWAVRIRVHQRLRFNIVEHVEA